MMHDFIRLVLLGVLIISVEMKTSYKIVELKEPFSISKDYRWRALGHRESDRKLMYSYSTMRVDEMTSKWQLDNSTDVTRHLHEVCFHERCPIFNPDRFLSMLRNKRMGIIGDSLGMQLFDGLHNSLVAHITTYMNTSCVVQNFDGTVRALHSDKYNATIYYCADATLQFGPSDTCHRAFTYQHTDFYIFGVGAHFKPKYMSAHRIQAVSYNESYVKSIEH